MMERDKGKAIRILYYTGNLTVRIVGSLIFLYLAWYAFQYTQYMLPGGYEAPVDVPDSRSRNLLGLMAAVSFMAVLMFLEKHIDGKVRRIICYVSGLAVALWIGMAGMWWISSSAHVPAGDQAFIYGSASYFMEGNYNHLGLGSYYDMYPFQLGLTALCELFFQIVGAYNYWAFEAGCVVLAVGSVYIGSRILSELTESMAVIVGYNVLISGCLPLIFYTAWVYGDIPSIFFALLAEWMLLRYTADHKIRYLAILVFSLVFAMLVRKNSLILLVAVCLAVLLYALRGKDKRIVLAFLLAVFCSYGSYEAIYKVYEVRSGYEHSNGIPMITWVTMGMQESHGTCGWYNNYPKELYYKTDCDKEMTAMIAKKDLQDRLKAFREDPSYARAFFKKKVLSQWNEPLYQALFFNAESPEKKGGPDPGSLASRLGGDYYVKVLAICDRWQFVVYVGMLCYFLFVVKKDSNILQHILAITMIGGFFFSIIHEAKARYIFPYYVMMFPFAAYGYQQTIRQITSLLDRKLKKRKPARDIKV